MRTKPLESVLPQKRQHSPLTHRRGADLRPHVLLNDVEAGYWRRSGPRRLCGFCPFDHLDRRDTQRLLPDLHRGGIIASGDSTADVGLVALVAVQPPACLGEEDRLEDRDIVVLVAREKTSL